MKFTVLDMAGITLLFGRPLSVREVERVARSVGRLREARDKGLTLAEWADANRRYRA